VCSHELCPVNRLRGIRRHFAGSACVPDCLFHCFQGLSSQRELLAPAVCLPVNPFQFALAKTLVRAFRLEFPRIEIVEHILCRPEPVALKGVTDTVQEVHDLLEHQTNRRRYALPFTGCEVAEGVSPFLCRIYPVLRGEGTFQNLDVTLG